MVSYTALSDAQDKAEAKAMIEKHVLHTGSERGSMILSDWDKYSAQFVRVMPNDYERMLEAIAVFEEGLAGEDALPTRFPQTIAMLHASAATKEILRWENQRASLNINVTYRLTAHH